jgi:hypothetical protein
LASRKLHPLLRSKCLVNAAKPDLHRHNLIEKASQSTKQITTFSKYSIKKNLIQTYFGFWIQLVKIHILQKSITSTTIMTFNDPNIFRSQPAKVHSFFLISSLNSRPSSSDMIRKHSEPTRKPWQSSSTLATKITD